MKIGLDNGLVPSGNKPLPQPMLIQNYVAIWRHKNELKTWGVNILTSIFADDECILSKERFCIVIQISLKFVSEGLIVLK